MFRNKEISWLSFNYRVLQEAKDGRNPLLERVKFLAIYASNLDEFYKVRVATLKKLMLLKKKTKQKLDKDPEKILHTIHEIVEEHQKEFEVVFEQIMQEFREHDIYLIGRDELNEDQEAFVKNFFNEKVKNQLIPVNFNEKKGIIFLKDQVLYLAAALKKQKQKEKEYALMEVPVSRLGRFVELPEKDGKKYVMMLEDVIRTGLEEKFPNYDSHEAYTVLLSRDAKLDIKGDISESIVKKVKKRIKKRQKGMPARLLHEPGIPDELLKIITERVGISEDQAIKGTNYLNFNDFFSFPDFGAEHLKDESIVPVPHPVLHNCSGIFEAIEQQDVLIHQPYHSFDYVLQFLDEAANDPDVIEIRITFYRLAKDSKVVQKLIEAAQKGKLVTVLMEIRARFDEESNIYWAKQLERAGANVLYGIPKLKVHAKICLVSKRSPEGIKHYAHLSTGNYNEDSAKIYIDQGYFTADKKITKELRKVFNYIVYPAPLPTDTFSNLLVAPFNMRQGFIDLINNEIANAKKGKEAYMLLKMNNLQDKELISKLYEAHEAGVKIKMVVRGICSLIPGVKGLSDKMEAVSIIDRFLEHGRFYIFANGGKPKYYISSADWMSKKLDYRIEVAWPVYDAEIQKELLNIMNLQLQDNVKARLLHHKKENQYKKNDAPPVRSQIAFHGLLKKKKQPVQDPAALFE